MPDLESVILQTLSISASVIRITLASATTFISGEVEQITIEHIWANCSTPITVSLFRPKEFEAIDFLGSQKP